MESNRRENGAKEVQFMHLCRFFYERNVMVDIVIVLKIRDHKRYC